MSRVDPHYDTRHITWSTVRGYNLRRRNSSTSPELRQCSGCHHWRLWLPKSIDKIGSFDFFHVNRTTVSSDVLVVVNSLPSQWGCFPAMDHYLRRDMSHTTQSWLNQNLHIDKEDRIFQHETSLFCMTVPHRSPNMQKYSKIYFRQ